MKFLVIYDVSIDKERNKLAQICLDFGMERIQKSAFIGELGSSLRKKLVKELSEKSPEKDFNLQIFELDKKSQKKILVWSGKKKGSNR